MHVKPHALLAHDAAAALAGTAHADVVYVSPSMLHVCTIVLDAHDIAPGVQIHPVHAPARHESMAMHTIVVVVSPLAEHTETSLDDAQVMALGVHVHGVQTPALHEFIAGHGVGL